MERRSAVSVVRTSWHEDNENVEVHAVRRHAFLSALLKDAETGIASSSLRPSGSPGMDSPVRDNQRRFFLLFFLPNRKRLAWRESAPPLRSVTKIAPAQPAEEATPLLASSKRRKRPQSWIADGGGVCHQQLPAANSCSRHFRLLRRF